MDTRMKIRVVSARVLGAWDQKRTPLEADLVELATLAQEVTRQPLGSHVVERLQRAVGQAKPPLAVVYLTITPAEAHELLLALGVEP